MWFRAEPCNCNGFKLLHIFCTFHLIDVQKHPDGHPPLDVGLVIDTPVSILEGVRENGVFITVQHHDILSVFRRILIRLGTSWVFNRLAPRETLQ